MSELPQPISGSWPHATRDLARASRTLNGLHHALEPRNAPGRREWRPAHARDAAECADISRCSDSTRRRAVS